MTDTPITVTLPLTQTGAYILLTALGIAAATGLVYLTLYGQEAKARPNPAMDLLTALGWAMVPVWFTLLGGTLWHLWLLATTGSSFLTDSSFGLGAVIAAFLGGPFVIWGTVLKQKTYELEKDRVNLDRETRYTDQISEMSDKLAAEKTCTKEGQSSTAPDIQKRFSALVWLERFAQDAVRFGNAQDHVRVMEILCAYVRENAPVPSLDSDADEDGPFIPRSDVQMALDVIKRRTDAQIRVEEAQNYRLDLRRTDFRGADISNGRFRAARLSESRFEFSRMRETDFSGAVFDRSVLNYVDCHKAKLIGANMHFCRIDKPKVQPGGFTISINLADVTGLSLAGSNITALDYIGDPAQPTFGTKDTLLEEDLDEQRVLGVTTMKRIKLLERKGEHEEATKLQRTIESNPFVHWSPFDSSDMATGMLLAEFREKLGLTGWPWNK